MFKFDQLFQRSAYNTFLNMIYFDLASFLVGGLLDLSKDWFKSHQVAVFLSWSSQMGLVCQEGVVVIQ